MSEIKSIQITQHNIFAYRATEDQTFADVFDKLNNFIEYSQVKADTWTVCETMQGQHNVSC